MKRPYEGRSWKHLGPIDWPIKDLSNRLNVEKVLEIKSLLKQGLSQYKIAKNVQLIT